MLGQVDFVGGLAGLALSRAPGWRERAGVAKIGVGVNQVKHLKCLPEFLALLCQMRARRYCSQDTQRNLDREVAILTKTRVYKKRTG